MAALVSLSLNEMHGPTEMFRENKNKKHTILENTVIMIVITIIVITIVTNANHPSFCMDSVHTGIAFVAMIVIRIWALPLFWISQLRHTGITSG